MRNKYELDSVYLLEDSYELSLPNSKKKKNRKIENYHKQVCTYLRKAALLFNVWNDSFYIRGQIIS